MITKIWVGLMLALTLFYVLTLLGRGIILLQEPSLIAIAMGLAILVLPLVALWALFAELQFGLKAQRLSRKLISLNIPGLDLELRASGRATKESANKELERIQVAVTKDPSSWSLWFQLGEAHDAAGERKNARAAIRQAIQLANNPDSANQ
jgi:cytochrome c-type biogenesis protein CcmH/NrfG|tara:strand:+ start:342 stop:794 length:453 start_codon:yes stop_codon:yes gene_type:complete